MTKYLFQPIQASANPKVEFLGPTSEHASFWSVHNPQISWLKETTDVDILKYKTINSYILISVVSHLSSSCLNLGKPLKKDWDDIDSTVQFLSKYTNQLHCNRQMKVIYIYMINFFLLFFFKTFSFPDILSSNFNTVTLIYKTFQMFSLIHTSAYILACTSKVGCFYQLCQNNPSC